MAGRISIRDLELRDDEHPSGGYVPDFDSDQSGMAVQAAREAGRRSKLFRVAGGGTAVGNPGNASLVGIYPSRRFVDPWIPRRGT